MIATAKITAEDEEQRTGEAVELEAPEPGQHDEERARVDGARRCNQRLMSMSAIPIATKHSVTMIARCIVWEPAKITTGSAPITMPATGTMLQRPNHTASAAGPGTPVVERSRTQASPPRPLPKS